MRRGDTHDFEPCVVVATEEHETLARQKIDNNAECQPDIRESEPREDKIEYVVLKRTSIIGTKIK